MAAASRMLCLLGRLGLAALIVALLAMAGPALARDLTEAEKEGLAQAVESFDAAMRAKDMDTVVGTIPPKVLAAIAEQSGVDVEQLRQAVVEQSKQAMSAVTVVSFGMDLKTAQYREATDGTPYVLIPTETVMDAGTGKMKATSQTLALLDEGKWYLLRVSDAEQVKILQTVYPQFAGLQFDPGTMEAVEE